METLAVQLQHLSVFCDTECFGTEFFSPSFSVQTGFKYIL